MKKLIYKDLCIHLEAEINKDVWGEDEIGEYWCAFYKMKPPCHRAVSDPAFVDMEECKRRVVGDKTEKEQSK